MTHKEKSQLTEGFRKIVYIFTWLKTVKYTVGFHLESWGFL